VSFLVLAQVVDQDCQGFEFFLLVHEIYFVKFHEKLQDKFHEGNRFVLLKTTNGTILEITPVKR